MSLDLEEALKVVLASSPQNVRRIVVLEIGHSLMTQTYYLSREPYTFTVETEDGVKTAQPLNITAKLAGAEGHLDQTFEITFDTTDIEDEFRDQMDLVPLGTTERVRCVYREYLSDNLTLAGILASISLQFESISYEVGAATIIATLPRFNVTRTGEIYSPRETPMLRGFL